MSEISNSGVTAVSISDFKRTVHPKMKILSFTYPNIIANTFDVFFPSLLWNIKGVFKLLYILKIAIFLMTIENFF